MSVIVLKLFKIGYSVQYMPTSINGISLITSLSTRRATTEITAGINCGKVKKRRKNTQLEKIPAGMGCREVSSLILLACQLCSF